jgi:thioredoxin
MKQITRADFDGEVLVSPQPVLVDFYTDGCAPCRAMSPVLQEWENEAKGAFKVVKIDASAEAELASTYRVNAVPAFLVFSKGRCLGQTIGMKSKSSMKKWFEDSLKSGD